MISRLPLNTSFTQRSRYNLVLRKTKSTTMQIFLILASSIAISLGHTHSQEKEPVFLCGRQLANARVILCYGTEDIDKKSLDNTFGAVNDEQWHEDWPWLGRRGALTASWSRYKREGLADLCCLKPCTTDVILNFC